MLALPTLAGASTHGAGAGQDPVREGNMAIDGISNPRPGWRAVARVLPVLALASTAYGQNFSQWSAAVNLGPVVNTAVNEGCPFVAKSDLTLFVVSTRAEGFGGQDLYVSQRDSALDPWGPLQNVGPTVNSAANDLCPTLSIDGHRLYFVSDRAGGCGKQDLYVVRRRNKRDDFGWGTPENLGCAVNSADNDFTPSLFEDETSGETTLYFGSDRAGGAGAVDIYASTRGEDGDFTMASLVPELSTPFVDERPNVRKDGLEIFIDSNRTGTLGGTDLWVASRANTSDPWSAPVNLGPEVNSASGEMRPALSFDGLTLYFSSTRLGGSGSSDIYAAARTKQPPQ
jgi:Tol biopolymer transport system component